MLAYALAAGVLHLSFWVEPCAESKEEACRPADAQLAEWALDAWQRASDGRLQFRRTTTRDQAQIVFVWSNCRDGLYGEARPLTRNGKRAAVIRVLTDTTPLSPFLHAAAKDDPLLRETIIYLTCLHESGHALGLRHTAQFEDVMYTFALGGDIGEYFGRYRRGLASRDELGRKEPFSEQDRQRLRIALEQQTAP